MLLNILLIMAIVAGLFLAGRLYFSRKLNSEDEELQEEMDESEYDIKYFLGETRNFFAQRLKRRFDDENLSSKDLEQKRKSVSNLKKAVTNARYGERNARKIIKSNIQSMLNREKYDLTERIDEVIHFNNPDKLKSMDKFEIVLHLFNKKYGEYKGLERMFTEYKCTNPVMVNGEESHILTKDRMNEIYEDVVIEGNSTLGKVDLDYNFKLDVLTQRLYERNTGFGAIDMLYYTNVDEIDFGVSGIPANSFVNNTVAKNMPYSYESIWIVFNGLNIQIEPLTFETQQELERVTTNVYRYNSATVMSRAEGRAVGTMIDGSRIVAVRPPFAESFGGFLRKFDSAPGTHPKDLTKHDKNNVIPLAVMKWMYRGRRNVAVTGDQGTGKTTHLKSFVRYMESRLNIRLQELQFEMNLRYSYPNRNIMSFQETSRVDAQEGLDLQKKTNGAINIIGEVASAIQAGFIIQTAKVASLFATFTHHAKTAKDLVLAIADNLLQIGLYSNKNDAVRASADILNIDCHLEKEGNGYRHISRITEIIPREAAKYPSDAMFKEKTDEYLNTHDIEKECLDYLFAKAMADTPEYYRRQTDPELFDTQDIVHWEPIYTDGEIKGGVFKFDRLPSEATMRSIENLLTPEEVRAFHRDMEMCEKLSNGIDTDSEEMKEWIEQVLSY